MKRVIALIVGLYLVGLSSANYNYLSLDGKEWSAISNNKSIKTEATVPGSIYSDLRRSGHLKNIYAEKNDINYRWVSHDNWTYERTFNVDSTLLTKQSVHLVAHGIDTVSTVYVNDKIVGKTDNQFVRYKFDLKPVLKTGKNQIKIAFESAPIYAVNKAAEFKKKYNYEVGPGCKYLHGECHWNFIRKMASSFSWDWGPAFPTQGIWKGIGIEAYDKAIIRDITVETTPNPKNKSEWTLTVNAFLETASDKEVDAVFNIELNSHNLINNQKHIFKPNKEETMKVTFVIPIKTISITPWFPNGVANNTQELYGLNVSLSLNGSTFVKTKKIGFRTIELVQEPIKPQGLTFYFKVNGIPFYAKGTNWIPANVLMEDLTPEYIRHLLESAKKSNMNFMRVWGGGIYESDLFYQIADELGIMIWQDFMFACALYPADPEFLKTVDAEVTQQVRRLQHHPSIAIWSGNNENENSASRGGPLIKRDYVELYINHVMKRIFEEDNTRPFVPSSPSNGEEEKKENWTSTHDGDERYGDVHYYNYDKPLWNWKQYPSGKFASEYGYIAYSSLDTYKDVIKETDFKVPLSDNMEWRQRHPGGTKSLDKQIAYYFKPPSNGGVDRFSDLVYLSQICQSMAMKTETEFYRRNREVDPKTGKGHTMGALYWQLNDIWQTSSWASIEYGGKWKMLQSYAVHFFSNILVSPYEDSNQTMKVSVVRDDYGGEKDLTLTVNVYKWSENKHAHSYTQNIKTNSFSAKVVFTKSIPELLKESNCTDRSECVVKTILSDAHQVYSANFMFLTEPKNSQLVKPNIKLVNVEPVKSGSGSTNAYEVTLSSEAIAPFVLLDFKRNSGLRGQFLDNGAFIVEGKLTQIVETDATLQQIKDNLVFKTVTDVQ